MIRTRLIIITAVVGMALNGCGFFPEATFTLSPASRLPSWFKLPSGYSRADVTVSMSYFVSIEWPHRSAQNVHHPWRNHFESYRYVARVETQRSTGLARRLSELRGDQRQWNG